MQLKIFSDLPIDIMYDLWIALEVHSLFSKYLENS